MTPKKQAEKLLSEYLIYFPEYYNDLEYDYNIEKAKKCALIAIDFTMNSKYSFQPMSKGLVSTKSYYEEVKQEIEKL